MRVKRLSRGVALLLGLLGLVIAGLIVAVVVLINNDGSSDNQNKNLPEFAVEMGRHFHLAAKADPFGGPTPLRTKFSADPDKQSGDVRYLWRFDDGTTSDEQNPTHTFPRAGYYSVTVQGTDEKGHKDTEGLFLGAWPPKVWAASKRRITPASEIRKQQRRTTVRKLELQRAARRKARG